MSIPENVLNLLNDSQATKVFTSVNSEGKPHSIVVGSSMAPTGDVVCCGEVMMKKTAANLAATKTAAVLVVKGLESYLLEVDVMDRQTEGQLFDTVKADLAKVGLPTHAVWTFKPTAIYNQSANEQSGTQIC